MSFAEILTLLRHIVYEWTLFKIQDVEITLNHIGVAIVSVIISLIISKWVRSLLKKRLLRRFQLDEGLEFALLRVVHYCVLIVGIYVGLAALNLPLGAFVGFLTLLGVGIGFGLQNLASNFISGIILLFERPVKIGDRITVDDVWGDVTRINLRTTVVNTPDNVSIIIPNSKLLENNLINWSYGERRIRLRIPVGVAYGSDVETVTELLKQAAGEVGDILDDPAPDVFFTEFGDSSLNFELIAWIPDSRLKPGVVNQTNRRIDALFRDHNIEIPFPQTDLHLRSSDVPLTRAP